EPIIGPILPKPSLPSPGGSLTATDAVGGTLVARDDFSV
ncbi:unnamed protein product, partial [marine sediment metagenome]